MKLREFDYNLPKELIAQEPIKPRDHSRLLVLDRRTGKIRHDFFYGIIEYLEKDDLLVINDTKVFPARLICRKKNTGGKLEVFLLRKREGFAWQCLIGGKGRRAGLEFSADGKLNGKLVKDNNDGTWEAVFDKKEGKFIKIINEAGQVPLPPYIKRARGSKKSDIANYQTVFADNKKTGSVAAPTAGLHFTPSLIKKIKSKGIDIACVTLHVGLGTFAPVKVEDLNKHKMHAEWAEIKPVEAQKIMQAKQNKKRIIAVGTTTVRTLEALLDNSPNAPSIGKKISGWVDLFILPGYNFKIVDAMVTNFHLPKSTLLMLVSAFGGKNNIDKAYRKAVKENYRFFSYGDAMLIK